MIQSINDDLIPQNIKTNSILRDTYIKYQELLQRGKLRLKVNKQINFDIGQQLYFFRNKDSLFFQHPDKQQEYYEGLIKQLSKEIKPQQSLPYHKQVNLEIQQLNKQKYTPETLKQEIIRYFKQKIKELKIRKQRTFLEEQNLTQPLNDKIYKARIQWIDNQIINLGERLERLKVDDGIKNYYETSQQLFSNLNLEDIEIFIRNKIWQRKVRQPLKKIESMCKWMHFLDRFKIQENQYKILNQRRQINQERNQKYFNDISQNIESKLNLKYQMSREVVLQLQEYLKPLKFQLEDGRPTHRYDRIPLMIFTDHEMQNRLIQIAGTFLKLPQQFGEQKLIFHLSNLQHMLDGYQKYLYSWDGTQKNEYEGYSGLQKLTIELSAFDDSEELINSLLKPLPIYPEVRLELVQNDWKYLLDQKNLVLDEYQIYMQNQLNFVTIDNLTEKIIRLLPIHYNKQMQVFIDQHIKQQRQDNFILFNIIENFDFIEYTRESLRQSQINELYEQKKSQEISYRHQTKFKKDLVTVFEELMKELTPKESHLQAYLNTLVCKIREYYRKIFYIINAIQSIERKLTFSLISIRNCKVNNIIDEQFLQKANIQTKQSENKIFDSTKHRRKAIISFCDAYQNVADKYINDFKNIKYEDQIFYKDEEMPDVFIKQKQINPIYDCANDEFKIVLQRLIQQISLYINKYEKLSNLKKINPIIDRFQCILDCFEEETLFQFQKLQLLQVYMIVFDNTINQQNQYQILDRMFEITKQIPLLDLESFYFQDSYKLNQQMFIEERQLLKILIDSQIKHEYSMIQQINDDYFSLKQQQINKQDILSKEQTPKETQRNNQNQESKLDEQYDYYNLSNKMSQIFQELNTSNKKSENNLSQNKELNNQIDYNAVLLPFQIYDEFTNINFFESLNQTIQIILSTKRSYKQLIQQFPQTSMQEYLSLQISCIQQAQIYVNQENRQPQIKKFNENTFIESHFGLVPKYLEHIKQTINCDLSSYIMNISLYDLEKALNQQNFNISDIWAISNLFEYLRLRKHFFDTQLEMKMHHRIHKRILNYEKMSKTADFYYKSNLSDIQSQYKKQQSIKYCFSPYCFEVDAAQEIAFIQLKQPELLVFQDVVEEFRNIILYDKINAMFLKTQNELRCAFLDEYYKTQIDLKQYSKAGYLPENSKLTSKILSQFDFNEKQILASLQRKPEDIDSFLILPKVIKADLFNKYQPKFKDRPKVQSQSEKMQILGQKKDQNLKLYLIKRLIKDFHQIVCYEAQKVEIIYKDFHIKKLIQIFPNNSKQMKLQELNQIIPQQYKQFGEKLETNIQIDYFYSKDDFKFDKYQDQITQQRKYLKRYEQYIIEILRHNTIYLNWFEMMHINELYLFNLEFDNYDQTKEMLYQDKIINNPIKSLLEYDKNHFDIKQCTSGLQINQKTLVAQGIDKMIDKIKCYYQINKVFEPFKENLNQFQKIEQIKELKENYLILYKKTFYLYHQTQFLISKDFSDSDYVQQFKIIRQYLFLQHKMNSINLKHYNTYFVQDFPIYRINQQKSLIHFKNKHSNNFKNQLQSILQLLPLNDEKQQTFYQTECHQNISQMIQIPGIIDINERIMLRKQNIDDIKDINNTMLIETYILLQTKFPYKIGGVDVKYHYNQLEQKLKQKIQLKELVYRQLVNTSIRALEENINLLQQYINIVPQYDQKDDIMQKLVSKINIAIPRVQFISSLQNTLSSKNNVIPSSLKQSFIQGFLNRLKNKSIQTNMLVSGVGYSISSQDIEDCINILNRDMYTFAENEISARMETFNLVYEQQQFQIKQLKRELQQTSLENQQLKQSFDEQLQTMVIAKSNKILFELEMLKQKFNDYKRCTQGLEEKVQEQIDNKYKVQIEELTYERNKVIEKFMDLKQQLITLFTQEVKTNEETLIKYIQQKTNEMLCEIPLYRKVNTIIIDQNEQNKQNTDLLYDPYKFTKALHQFKDKLQQENQNQKINYEEQLVEYKKQCNNYEDLKLQFNESKKRENTMKMELITLQQRINQLIKQKDELTEQIDQLRYDKKRLIKSNEDMQQQVKQYKEKYKNQDNRRRNAISVENYSMTQSIVERKTLPKLFKSEQKPKLKL